jgi:hypothetical protein
MVYIKSGFDPVIPLTHSRIGINNIARTGTVTASTADAGFPAIAAANPLTYEFWKPTTVPATWTVDAGAAVTCDYLGVASHTLGTSATTLTLQHSTDNSTWEDVETVTPSTNFDPFVEQARSYPFFFAWRPQGYADSVGYVWTNTDITPSTMGIRSRLEVSFAMEGLSLE